VLGLVNRDEEGFAQAWADELMQLRSDPVARRVAGGFTEGDRVPGGLTGNAVADAKRWFWEGPGKRFREDMAEASGRDRLLNRRGADDYIDSVWDRIKIKTGENPDLMGALATGKLSDVPIRTATSTSTPFVSALSDLAAQGIGPGVVKGDLYLLTGKMPRHYDRAVERMFHALMSKPTNWLSRSPSFRQFYWTRVEELVPRLDEASRAKVIANARHAKLPRHRIRQMEGAAKRVPVPSEHALTAADADVIAKGFGLDETRKRGPANRLCVPAVRAGRRHGVMERAAVLRRA
jgi:hypothetical protein